MANIKSAKKRIKTIDKKTARNARVKAHVREAEKEFLASVASGNIEDAQKAFGVVEKRIMQAATRGIYHKNTASRTVSRLERKLNTLKADK